MFALMISPLIASGQIRVGSNEFDIRDEFKEQKQTISYNDLGEKILTIEFDNWLTQYKFDSRQVCSRTLIFPYYDKTLHGIIEDFNKTYVVVDDHTWKQYVKNNVVIIKLAYDEDIPGYIFLAMIPE